MATYKKRKDGRYARQIVIGLKNGKAVKKTVYGKTIKELDKNYRDFMGLKDKGVILQDQSITIHDLSWRWMENFKRPALKPQSYQNLSSQINIMNSHIGHYKVINFSTAHLEAYRDIIIAAGKYDQYNKALSCLRSILDYGIQQDIIVRNVTDGMPRMRRPDKKEKRSLTAAERKAVEAAELDPMERCYVNILLYTGARRSEALALDIDDINLRERYVHIRKTMISSAKTGENIQETTKTASGVRKIPMTNDLYQTLTDYCSNRIHGPLFPSSTGGYIASGTFYTRWQRIAGKIFPNGAPWDFTPHLFRHNYASDLYKSGMDIKAAQYLLGHSDIKTTLDIYTHFGYVDVKISCLEKYYEEVKRKSEEKETPQKARKTVPPGV